MTLKLYVRDENAGYAEACEEMVLSAARQVVSRRFCVATPVTDTRQAKDFLRMYFGTLDHEVFGLIYLNGRRLLIHVETLFRGTLGGAHVHPREVVKAALAHNAAAVICFHNHPSGACEPSVADNLVTKRLQEALALVDIALVDHLIVGESVYSFAEAGRL